MKQIFPTAGKYIIGVTVVGDGVDPVSAKLELTLFTGKSYDKSLLEKLPD